MVNLAAKVKRDPVDHLEYQESALRDHQVETALLDHKDHQDHGDNQVQEVNQVNKDLEVNQAYPDLEDLLDHLDHQGNGEDLVHKVSLDLMVSEEHEVKLVSKVNKDRAVNQETGDHQDHPDLEDSQARLADQARLVSEDHLVRTVELEPKEPLDDPESKGSEVSGDSLAMPHNLEHPDRKVSYTQSSTG